MSTRLDRWWPTLARVATAFVTLFIFGLSMEPFLLMSFHWRLFCPIFMLLSSSEMVVCLWIGPAHRCFESVLVHLAICVGCGVFLGDQNVDGGIAILYDCGWWILSQHTVVSYL